MTTTYQPMLFFRPFAKFLNDVTIDAKGTVYVSDSQTKKVHAIKDGKVSTYTEGLNGPNGLLAVGSDLLILDSGSLKKLSSDKKMTTIAEGMEKSTDGIEQVDPATDVGPVVLGRLLHAFRHQVKGGEVKREKVVGGRRRRWQTAVGGGGAGGGEGEW